jgi:hypothetical protein
LNATSRAGLGPEEKGTLWLLTQRHLVSVRREG